MTIECIKNVSALHVASEVTVLRMSRLVERLGIARSTIYDWMNPLSPRYDDKFPIPMRLSNCAREAIGWLESDIYEWLKSRDAVGSRKSTYK